jgi:hypothetical protein
MEMYTVTGANPTVLYITPDPLSVGNKCDIKSAFLYKLASNDEV